MPSVGTITGTLRLIDIFTGPLAVANTQLLKTATAMQTAGRSMAVVGAKMSTAITLPLVAAAGASFHFASTFERSMTKVETLSGAGREDIQGWKEDLLALAVEAGRSPRELADALFFLSSSGLETSQVMDVLTVSAKAAAIGLGDTEVIASTLSTIVNAYAFANLEAADALNILALGVKSGTAEVEDFAPALGRITGQAAALGISFEDVVGVLSAMSLTNLNVAETTTSLGQVFNTLLGSGKQAKDTLAKMNLTFSDLREMAAKPNGLIDIMNLLNDSFKLEELKLIVPNIRAFRAFMNILAQDSSKVADVMEAVASGVDVLGAGFARVAENPGFKFRQLLSAVLVELIALGDSPAFGTLFEFLIKLIRLVGTLGDAFDALPGPIKSAALTFTVLLTAMGPLMTVVGRGILVFTSMAAVIKLVFEQIVLLNSISAFNVFRIWSFSASNFTAAAGKLALKLHNVVGLMALAPKGLTTTFKNATKHSGSFTFGLKEVGKHISKLSGGILGLLPGGKALIALFSSPITWIVALGLLVLSLKPVQEWLKKVWRETEDFRRLMVETAKVMKDWIKDDWEELKEVLIIVSDIVKGFTEDLITLNPIIMALALVVEVAVDALQSLADMAGDSDREVSDLEKAINILNKGLSFLLIPGLNRVAEKFGELVTQAQKNIEATDNVAISTQGMADRAETAAQRLKNMKTAAELTAKILKDKLAKDAAAAAAGTGELADAQKRWGDIVDGLRTPMETYLDSLRDLITTGRAAGKSIGEITEQVLRLKPELEKIEIKVLTPEQIHLLNLFLAGMGGVASITGDTIRGWEGIGDIISDVTKVELQKLIDGLGEMNHFDAEIGTAWDGIKQDIAAAGEAMVILAKDTEMWGALLSDVLRGAFSGESFEETIGEAGAQAGFIFGSVFGGIVGGPIGAAIGGALGEAIGKKLGETIGKFLDGSKSLGQKVREFFDGFDAGNATINETVKGITLLTNAVNKLSEKKAGKLLADNFDAVLEAAKRLGGEAVDALAELAAAAHETGVGLALIEEARTDALDEFIGVLQKRSDLFRSSAEAIIGGIEKMGLATKGAIEFAGTAIVQAFNAMVLSGASIIEIVELLGDQFGRIEDAGKQLGVELPAEFQRVGVVIAALSEGPLKQAITSLEGMGQVAKAVGDIGMLTGEQFDALGRKVKGTFNKLVEGGLTGKEALAAIAPHLQTLWDLSQQYGFAIDKNTMSLIDEAGALGLVTNKGLTTEDILIKGFDRILESLNAIIIALGGVPVALDEWISGTKEVENQWTDSMGGMESDISSLSAFGKEAMEHIADGAKQAALDATNAWAGATAQIPGKARDMLNVLRREFESIPIRLNIKGLINVDPTVPAFDQGSSGLQNFGTETLVALHGEEEILTENQSEGIATMVQQIANGATGGTNEVVAAIKHLAKSVERSNEKIESSLSQNQQTLDKIPTVR